MKLRYAAICISILLLAASVFASLSIPSSLDLGGSDQDKFDDNGNSKTITKDFTLTASSFTYSGINFEFIPQNNFPSSNINVINIPSSASGSHTLRVNLTIPSDFSSVNADLEETDFDIGKIKIISQTGVDPNNSSIIENNIQSNEMQLTLQVENSLSMPSLKLIVGSSETSVSSGNTVTVHAGDDVRLAFTVKNRFPSDSDVEFNTVSLKVKSDDLDIDEDSEIEDIGAGEEKSKNINFDINDEETGTFDIDVDVKGTDEYGGLHGFEYDFKLNVQPGTISNEEVVEDNEVPDSDDDGISDLEDFCPDSLIQCQVDARGCEIDSDNDGTCNSLDSTPLPDEEIQQSSQTVTTNEANNNNEKSENVAKEKKESSESEGFIPFIIGFLIGLILTAAFFILIRS